MRRREFITIVGGATAAVPFAALAQPQIPLVGFLNSASPETYRFNADSFREGLTKAGFVEGRNVRIEERWARGDYSALPTLAAELVAAGVAAIAATGDVASARAAQTALDCRGSFSPRVSHQRESLKHQNPILWPVPSPSGHLLRFLSSTYDLRVPRRFGS